MAKVRSSNYHHLSCCCSTELLTHHMTFQMLASKPCSAPLFGHPRQCPCSLAQFNAWFDSDQGAGAVAWRQPDFGNDSCCRGPYQRSPRCPYSCLYLLQSRRPLPWWSWVRGPKVHLAITTWFSGCWYYHCCQRQCSNSHQIGSNWGHHGSSEAVSAHWASVTATIVAIKQSRVGWFSRGYFGKWVSKPSLNPWMG